MRKRTRMVLLLVAAVLILVGCEEQKGTPSTPPPAPQPAADLVSDKPANPSADRIVFSSFVSGSRNREIYTMFADGSGWHRLTRNLQEEWAAGVYPDSPFIYYVCEESICLNSSAGGEGSILLTAHDFDLDFLQMPSFDSPVMSPDATRMLVAVQTLPRGGRNLDLYMWSFPDDKLTKVAVGPAQDDIPAWVNDTRIIWSRQIGGDFELMTFDLNAGPGSKPVQLTNNDVDDLGVDVSPDGSTLSWVALGADRNAQLMTMPFSATTPQTPTVLTSMKLYVGLGEPDTAWSPDGTRIAYHASDPSAGEDSEIWTIPATGGTPTNVTDNASHDLDPDWAELPPSVFARDPRLTREDAGSVTFELRLDAPSSQPTTVSYRTVAGTAAAGSDFTAKSGTETFAPGQTVKQVQVTLVNDTTPEPLEEFTLEITDATGQVLVADDVAEAKIADDDPEPTPTSTVTPTESPTGSPSPTPTVPAAGRIAFVRQAGGFGQLFTMLSNGTDVRHISGDQASSNLDTPSWSTDGAKVIYTALNGAQPEIVERAGNGSGSFTLLVLHPSQDVEPAYKGGSSTEYWWSSNEHGDFDLFRGPGRNHVTTSTAQERNPSFGNDPTKMAFEADYDGDFDIHLQTLTAAGQPVGTPENLTQEATGAPASADVDPDMSADGSKVVFSSDRNGNRDIYVVTVATKAVIRLTTDSGAEYQPTFSADGQHIAFVREVGGDPEIFRMTATGGSPVNISNNPGGADTDPDWGPASTSAPRSLPSGGTALTVVVPLGLLLGVGFGKRRRHQL